MPPTFASPPGLPAAAECVICLSAPRETVLTACGHAVLCASCADSLVARQDETQPKCPVCTACIPPGSVRALSGRVTRSGRSAATASYLPGLISPEQAVHAARLRVNELTEELFKTRAYVWAVGAYRQQQRPCSARVSSASALESPKPSERACVTQRPLCLHRTAPPASLTRALAHAVAYAPVATITRLLDAGVSVSCVALVQTLLISGSILGGPVSVQSGPLLCDCPLTAAARLHRGDVVRMLLDRGADPRWTSPLDRATPLHHALGGSAQPQSSAALDESSAEARLSVVTALLESGCDVNAKTRGPDASSALHLAARCRDHAVVTALLSANADVGAVDASGMVPLHVAVTTGCAATVSALLAGGADVNCMWADKDMSSVMMSAIDGSVDVLNTLLAAGGSVQVPGTGVTLLHAVCAFGQKNRPEVAALLIAHDNNLLNAVDDAGETCLHIAAKGGSVDVLRELIARGASVGVSNLAGETAAHAAAKRGRIAACLLLAEKCPALLTVADGAGHTPEVVADLRGHAELASALASIAERGIKRSAAGGPDNGVDGGGEKPPKKARRDG